MIQILGKYLICKDNVFKKMYFFPKIHKEDVVPLCSILSFIGPPKYKISKYVSDRPYLTFTNNHILMFLDAITLFTNIDKPRNLTLII